MRVVKIEQNSEEWEEFRKGKSGGSELKDLWTTTMPTKEKIISYLISENRASEDDLPSLKKSTVAEIMSILTPRDIAELKIAKEPKKRYYTMLAELVARPLTPNDYADKLNGEPYSPMARGHILEPQAADAFEKATGKKLDEDSVIWVRDSNKNSYISPDRTITSKDGKVREAVEIKCFYSDTVLEIWKTGKIPEEYMPQIAKYFMVNEDLETLYWVVYTDLIPGLELQIFTVKRDDIKNSIEELEAYEDFVLDMLEKDVKKIDKLSGF